MFTFAPLVWSTIFSGTVFGIDVLHSLIFLGLFFFFLSCFICGLLNCMAMRHFMSFPLLAHVKGLQKSPVLRSAGVFGKAVVFLHR